MTKQRDDRKHDRTVEDSFPASDPPANNGIVGPRAVPPKPNQAPRPNERCDEARPKGTPTHERHATETAYQWEDEDRTPDR